MGRFCAPGGVAAGNGGVASREGRFGEVEMAEGGAVGGHGRVCEVSQEHSRAQLNG